MGQMGGSTLTRREYEVLVLSAEGEMNAGVASILGIKEHTVRGYVKSLRLKLGAKNMTHAVAIAFAAGILGSGGNPFG